MKEEEQMKARIDEEIGKQVPKKVGKVVGVVAAVFAGIFFVAIFGLLLGWAIQWLWNNTLVALFDWPTLSYWQAVGLFVLAKIFFGFGHSGGHHAHHKHKKRPDEANQRVHRWWSGRMGTRDDGAPPTDAEFRKYWQEQGKEAYGRYLASRGEGPKSIPE